MQSIETLWKDATALTAFNYYISWIGWGLTVVGVIITACSMLISRQIDSLNKAESAASQKKIEALEIATRPKPIRERIITQLNSINPLFMDGLKKGQNNFSGNFSTLHYTDLQRIASEPGAETYILFQPSGVVTFTTSGETHSANLTLYPSLLMA
jgi:hypothetical protein